MKGRLLITVLATGWLFVSCTRHPVAAAIRDLCREPDKASVQTEGYIRLPMSNVGIINEPEVRPEHILIIVEKENGTGTFVNAVVRTTDSHEPNRIASLPSSYTYADLHIITDSGIEISLKDRLKITGRIAKDSKPCILEIEKIETQ